MGLIINKSDYKRPSTVSIEIVDNSEIDAYIDRYERLYIKRILGDNLAALFIADLDLNGVPQTPKYLTIYSALFVEWCSLFAGTNIYRSEGLKTTLLNLVGWEFMRKSNVKQMDNGGRVQDSETSSVISHGRTYEMYNDAVESIRAIQYFILKNLSDYQEFKGEKFDYAHPLV